MQCAALTGCEKTIMSTGMKKDTVHQHFESKTQNGRPWSKCRYCPWAASGSDRQRLMKHLAECADAGVDTRTRAEMRYAELYSKGKRSADTAFTAPMSMGASTSSSAQPPRNSSGTIPSISSGLKRWIDDCSSDEKSRLDEALAEMFYQLGLPFSLVDDDIFRAFIKLLRPAYEPPSRKQLAGPMILL